MDAKRDDTFVEAWIAALPPAAWQTPSGTIEPVTLAYVLRMEWSNGGFHQFFGNPSGDRWQETLAALGRIGASRVKTIFESALAVFPNSIPSTDHLTRGRQLDDAGAHAIGVLDRLDDEYMALEHQFPDEELYAKMAEFLRRHGVTARG